MSPDRFVVRSAASPRAVGSRIRILKIALAAGQTLFVDGNPELA